jgi:aminoglycoside phosphotransferase (APT) family kinase protein
VNRPPGFLECFDDPEEVLDLKPLDGGWSDSANFFLRHRGNEFVFRLINSSPEARLRELKCTELAGNLGLGPRVEKRSPKGSWALIEFIRGTTLQPSDLADPELAGQLGRVLSKLHATPTDGVGIADTLSQRFQRVLAKQPPLSDAFGEMKFDDPVKVQPSFFHNDFHFQNLLRQGNRLVVIDWGNAGVGDRAVDLAQLAVLSAPEHYKVVEREYAPVEGSLRNLGLQKRKLLAIMLIDHRGRALEHTDVTAESFDSTVLHYHDPPTLHEVAQSVFSGQLKLDTAQNFATVSAAALNDLRRLS